MALLPEIQNTLPQLIERHSFELVYVLPELRRSLTVRNPNLTDLAPASERTRNYPADRAYRNVHGLIDLLNSWKTADSLDVPWVIACDDWDSAGAMTTSFFKELIRRRAKRLNLSLLVAVAPGEGKPSLSSFSGSVPLELSTLELESGPPATIDRAEAARMAVELEQRIGGDRLEIKIHLSELIRLWRFAERPDKLLEYKFFGLETYNTAGLYADALRYGDELLALAAEQAPGDKYMGWSIVVKLIMSHIGLGHVDASLKLAEEDGPRFVEHNPEWHSNLLYLLAMFHARFKQPRDLVKGEEYLERSLQEIGRADLPEGERYFNIVFNRNGLAMIRNFQGRRQEAIELCRKGIETLNLHLGADEHRLHRSILFYNMAQVYAALGSRDEALQYYSVAIEMDSNYSEYYNERGNVLLSLARLSEARADYLKAIELSPPYFEVFTNLGQCYRRLGAMADAIRSYSRALDLDPNQVLALLGRADAREKLKQSEAAIEDYTAALALDPTLWEAIANRAALHYERGDLAASLADINRAIELKPDLPDLRENREALLARIKCEREANRTHTVLMEVAPRGAQLL
jgi:tetratricopeptide (TPR) repeat protein